MYMQILIYTYKISEFPTLIKLISHWLQLGITFTFVITGQNEHVCHQAAVMASYKHINT